MPLVSGTRLGPYEIVAPLGAGGMGEVYRARDTRLDRDVAIKVLPEHLSRDPEFRERFEREARAISQLSHPHICVLHDIGKRDGSDFLVLEYLEGETLGVRLRRGALPAEQVLKFGAQIADALDKAHRRGVVHRDLKPDNVMLTKSGVKLLDFGLAKPFASPVSTTSNVSAVTLTLSPLTAEGTLVGTFQYMAPEQLEGKEADARSDIFALGCVLYEMATGKRAFDGKSVASVVAAIMNTEPAPVSAVAPLTPPALEWATRKCMVKDPEERWQSAGDLASELRWIQEGGSRAGVAVPATTGSGRRTWRWAALAATLAVGCLLGFLLKQAPIQPVIRTAINLPSGTSMIPDNGSVLSPDGQRVVMTLVDPQGKWKFWVRQLSTEATLPLDGTEGGIYPFWSPDSRSIGFFAADGKVRKIAATGGSADAVCDVWQVYGGAWGPGDIMVFDTGARGFYQVSAAGGTPVRVPNKQFPGADYRWPSFLPDGKHILVSAIVGGIYVMSLDTGEVEPLLPGETSAAKYAAPGYVLFLRGDSLMAQPFDAQKRRFSGAAQRVAESIYNSPTSFSSADNGMLLYQHSSQTQLTWYDSDGTKLGTVGEPGLLSAPYISQDGKFAMVNVTDLRLGNQKLWLYDLAQGTSAPFSFGEGTEQYPAWSPDNRQVAFSSTRNGQEDIYIKGVAGGSQETLLNADPGNKEPDQWSPDGRYLLFDYIGRKDTGTDVFALPLFGDRKPFPVVNSPANENWAAFSPDGKWVSYSSDESGRGEVYASPFPGPGGKIQISTTGGIQSYWLPGNRFFYITPLGRIVSVDVTVQGANLVVGKSHTILGDRWPGNAAGVSVAPDGKRWLVAASVAQPNASPLVLTTNWTAALQH